MRKFIADLILEQQFARDSLDKLGTFFRSVASNVSPECSAELVINRFTFGLITLYAPNRNEAGQYIAEAWERAGYERSQLNLILVSELTGDKDRDDLITAVYKGYYGVDSYMRLVTDLNAELPVLAQRNSLDAFRQQNYLFAIDGGCGFTTLIRSFSDYLHRMHIYPEEEYDKRGYYYDIKLGKETEGDVSTAEDIITLLSEKKDDNPYSIIGLDISYYLDGRKYDELRSFINRLDKYQDNYVFAFRIPFLEKKAFDEIEGILSDMMLVKTIQVPPLTDSVLIETAWNVLIGREYSPDTDVIGLILSRIEREKNDGRFYGFKTAMKIGYEIVLEKAAADARLIASGGEPAGKDITLADLSRLAASDKGAATGFDALKGLVGMEEISRKVSEIVAQVKYAIANEKLDRPCIHMRFTGSPGTGKTTVARIIGQILREEGVLRKGGFFEYEARDLVAEYEGQTAVKTASLCRDAYGSVLFIDEAYALNEGGTHGADFGKEALATLVSQMENHRDDMLVVMAGYEKEMDDLMKVNPGLRSRMPYILHFPNYTREQLFRIFMQMTGKSFKYEPELEAEAHRFFMELSDGYLESKEFANARFARNLYERTWSKGALRCSMAGKTEIVLTKEDFAAASSEKEFSEKIETKKKVGFTTA